MQLNVPHTLEELDTLRTFLEDHGTFIFPQLKSGLYRASTVTGESEYTGYQNVWVRDNVFIANSRREAGHLEEAKAATEALMRHFIAERPRFQSIIQGKSNKEVAINRPHIRFNGETGGELDEKWAHAQNDALGYFLWLYCREMRNTPLSVEAATQLAYFVHYFIAIEYWQDADSGHWEEARKIEASSIGPVIAGLQALLALMQTQHLPELACPEGATTQEMIIELIIKGCDALDIILPNESIQPGLERAYDSALLFSIYPLSVISGEQADQVIANVHQQLQGDYGIKRYLGDSFWCANYKEKLSKESRTVDYSENMASRDALVKKGEEAQWCIFDPILSIIYGQKYAQTRSLEYRDLQLKHFQRSLSQITTLKNKPDTYLCPELYYLHGDTYEANDVIPLLWTQANLSLAFKYMERTLLSPSTDPNQS